MSDLIDFSTPPPLGHHIRVKLRRRFRWCQLIDVNPYIRRDGVASFVLTWEDDKGYRYTSGLRSKSLTLVRHGNELAVGC
jgi:hypothetical protein